MEDDDDLDYGSGGETKDGVDQPPDKVPEWATPARRIDDIGAMAWRAVGSGDLRRVDTSALGPLADAIRSTYGEAVAHEFQARIMSVTLSPRRFRSRRDQEQLANNILAAVRDACRPFLYDFGSVCAAFGAVVEAIRAPVAPLEKLAASVEVVMMAVHFNYGPGDRVELPDGRQGIVVTPRGPDGRAGVMPTENNFPGAFPDAQSAGSAYPGADDAV